MLRTIAMNPFYSLLTALSGLWAATAHCTPISTDSCDSSQVPDYMSVDAEAVYYAQPKLVADKMSRISSGNPGEVEVYFIGFAGSGDQTVFTSEARFAAEVVDRHYDTRGRSVLLQNNIYRLDDEPLANTYNLFDVVEATAQRMDRDEDVLFLYLTSHGESDGSIDVSLNPLDMQPLYADDLRKALDSAGITWRIIVVSACYSGSFIAPLRDDRTLIVTASAADRNSFGCSDDRELTYFGEEFLKDAFGETGDLLEAFEIASRSVVERELDEGRTPSDPQIFIGRDIREKLLEVERPE